MSGDRTVAKSFVVENLKTSDDTESVEVVYDVAIGACTLRST